jgi:hypothetical protein
MTISPETLAWLRQCAALDGAAYPQVLLHLLDRVEALEQESTCKQSLQVPPTPEAAPVATDEELCRVYDDAARQGFGPAVRALYDLGRQHGAAQPEPPVAPKEKSALAQQAYVAFVQICKGNSDDAGTYAEDEELVRQALKRLDDLEQSSRPARPGGRACRGVGGEGGPGHWRGGRSPGQLDT